MDLTSNSRAGEKPEFWQDFPVQIFVCSVPNSCSSLLIEALKQDFREQYDSDHIYFWSWDSENNNDDNNSQVE